jgi:hypothetical protein
MSVRKKIVKAGDAEATWWIADYFDGTGQRHQRRFKTKKEATAHHDKTKTAIRSGEHVSVSHDLTIQGTADVWLNGVAADQRERGTLKQYERHVRCHILPRVGNLKVAKMSKKNVEAFRNDLLTGDHALSRVMARKVMVSFKSILRANGVSHLGDHRQDRRQAREEGRA